MHPEERERRLQFASDILFALKTSGCSQRLVAAYMRISHSTLSHWRRGREDTTRKVGVPSDEQMTRLVALWRYHMAQGLARGLDCQGTSGLDRREGILMLHAIGSLLEEYTGYYEQRQQAFEQLVAKTHDIIKLVGLEDAKLLLKPVSFVQLGDAPAPTEQEWAEAHAKRKAEAEEALAACAVTRAEMERARQDMDEWVKKQMERAHARMRAKVLNEKKQRLVSGTQERPDDSPTDA